MTSRSYKMISPDTSITFSGIATSPYGTASCSASVTITPAPLPPPAPVVGCMDSTATNYNPSATSEAGMTCTYPIIPVLGCMDATATNYNPSATANDGSCTYPPPPPPPIYGCMDSSATNYNPNATVSDGSCTYPTTNPVITVVPPAVTVCASDEFTLQMNVSAAQQVNSVSNYLHFDPSLLTYVSATKGNFFPNSCAVSLLSSVSPN